MLYVQEKVVKLGGIYLEGQVTSVEVQEAGSVYVAQDEKGRYKKSQPVGYENAKVMIDILLEDTKTATTLEQLTEMQRLFKPYGQDKPKLLPIVNEDCAVRGITKVYFKNLTSKKVISESKRIASLELWAPDIAGIKVKKKTTKKKTTKKSTKKSKSKKSKSKSPAKDSRNTSRGKKAAMTEEGELFYEDEEGDASYGWSLLDFMQGEYDDFTQMEIQQRIRSKMSKRDYIDAGSIQTTVNFDGHIYHIRIAFRRTDSNSEYNIDIESNGVEVIVE